MFITKKSKQYNEDGILNAHPYYLVIDGATPLSKDKKSAHLLKTYVIRNFIKEYEVHRDIKKTLQILSKNYYINHDYAYKRPISLPSAGLSIVIDHGSKYELFLLGDTYIAIEYIDGSIEVFHDDRLTIMDNEALQIKDPKARLNRIKYNRNQLGKSYDAFVPRKKLVFKDFTRYIDKKDVKKLRLYTDGFSSIIDTYNHIHDLRTFMDTDIKTIAKAIKSISFDDKEMTRYPRFKIIDDISVIEISNVTL